MRTAAGLGSLVAALLFASPAQAFDYLEHSYLTDRSCLEAQRLLAPHAKDDPNAAARYLALSLLCPESWKRPYCAEGYKQLEGSLNRLAAPPAESGDHSATFGDFAALQDHLSELGEVHGVPQAEHEGLATRVLEWLAETGDAGGVIADVAEDGCETQRPLPWKVMEDALEKPPPADLPTNATARGPAERVAYDKAGPYSFDNPQYLDLVLHNNGHFGALAFTNWQQLHATARDVAGARCEDVLPRDPAIFAELAAGLPELEKVAWKKLDEPARARLGCDVVAERLRLRALEWAKRAQPELVAPVQPLLSALAGADAGARHDAARRLPTLVLGLVFEGAGLHYLQDVLSGGHVRVERAAYGLRDSRYQHDTDSANGIAVRVTTAEKSEELLAFGDGYLLGEADALPACDASAKGVTLTHCLLARQRRWILEASAASLLDWTGTEPDYVRAHFLLATPAAASTGTPESRVHGGAVPNPMPPIAYQSFLLSTSLDASGGSPQLGVRTVFLSALGARANWMTSYHVGLLTRLGQGHESQLNLELSYMFHWRWAARWTLNAGPYVFGGLAGLNDNKVDPMFGIGPSIGTSVLPEGWIQLPLEVTFSYRVPVRLLDGRYGFDRKSVGVEAHWLELAMGLAFM